MFKTIEYFNYEYENKRYDVILTRKRMKSVQYRFKDGKFLISAPRLAGKTIIMNGLEKFGPKLLKRSEKNSPLTDDGVFVFGEKYPFEIVDIEGKEIDLRDRSHVFDILKSVLLEYVTKGVEYYSKEMNINENYKVKVRNTKTRLGSNSRRTKTLAFALSLVHFSKEIIDSVIIHELAHCKVFNHSKDFYNVVYQHCPHYNVYRKKLIHSEFK